MQLKKEAVRLKNNIENSNYNEFIKTLNRGWIAKQKTSRFIVNKDISLILKKLKSLGADAIKVSGAGGGGFFFILTKLENRLKLIKYLKKQNGIITETCNITMEGVKTWKY